MVLYLFYTCTKVSVNGKSLRQLSVIDKTQGQLWISIFSTHVQVTINGKTLSQLWISTCSLLSFTKTVEPRALITILCLKDTRWRSFTQIRIASLISCCLEHAPNEYCCQLSLFWAVTFAKRCVMNCCEGDWLWFDSRFILMTFLKSLYTPGIIQSGFRISTNFLTMNSLPAIIHVSNGNQHN